MRRFKTCITRVDHHSFLRIAYDIYVFKARPIEQTNLDVIAILTAKAGEPIVGPDPSRELIPALVEVHGVHQRRHRFEILALTKTKGITILKHRTVRARQGNGSQMADRIPRSLL